MKPHLGWPIVLAALVACGPAVELATQTGAAGETGTSSTPTATTAPSPTGTPPNPATSASPTTASTSSTDASTGSEGGVLDEGGFLSLDAPLQDCTIWEQNCPPGEKCTAWADDGESAWNANRCVPVADNPVGPGEPCTVEGVSSSGIDNCDATSMCMPNFGESDGYCVAFCTGSPDAPVCGSGELCIVSNEDSLVLCWESCDPMAQDCAADEWACWATPYGGICAPGEVGPGGHGTACAMIAACSPGFVCVVAGAVAGCPGEPCCAAYCDTEDVGADEGCPGYDEGERCLPAYPEGDAPEGLEHLGICIIP